MESTTKSSLHEKIPHDGLVAYSSMEIALDSKLPTYSGGLGILAGDTLRSAADLGVPMVGFTLVHRQGYFKQLLDAEDRQTEQADPWKPAKFCTEEAPRVTVSIEGRTVWVRAWRYDVVSPFGYRVPVYMLDTDVADNQEDDKHLTDCLYGGNGDRRLKQEIVLGMGGVRIANALGLHVNVYHMNEGHAALLTLALLESQLGTGVQAAPTDADVEAVQHKCVFTTHTPVPAGHDTFSIEQTTRILGRQRTALLQNLRCVQHGRLNMTLLALRMTRYANGVSMQHAKVAQAMFPEFTIDAITNGVHAPTWISEPVRRMLDEHIPAWRRDNRALRYVIGLLPDAQILAAHAHAKRNLLDEVIARPKLAWPTGSELRLDPKALTLGFARRAVTYKRFSLMLTDRDRLRAIAHDAGGLHILCGGKAHPDDGDGKRVIREVIQRAEDVANNDLRIVFLENYDWTLGALMTAGVDVWVNTPERYREASGTSGMKAALNGVPSLSILDGWWIEGCIEGITGWAIEDGASDEEEARSLYTKLEAVVPLYRGAPEKWAQLMRTTMAYGSFFNTNRMLEQYVVNAYHPRICHAANVEEEAVPEYPHGAPLALQNEPVGSRETEEV